MHLPLVAAANALQLSGTTFKKLKRARGITKWPFRQLNALLDTYTQLWESRETLIFGRHQVPHSVETDLEKIENAVQCIRAGGEVEIFDGLPVSSSDGGLVSFSVHNPDGSTMSGFNQWWGMQESPQQHQQLEQHQHQHPNQHKHVFSRVGAAARTSSPVARPVKKTKVITAASDHQQGEGVAYYHHYDKGGGGVEGSTEGTDLEEVLSLPSTGGGGAYSADAAYSPGHRAVSPAATVTPGWMPEPGAAAHCVAKRSSPLPRAVHRGGSRHVATRDLGRHPRRTPLRL